MTTLKAAPLAPTAAPRSWWRTWAIPITALVVFFLVKYVWPNYVTFDPSKAQIVLDPGFPLHYPVLVLHIVTGTIALAAMCAQAWPWLRRRYPEAHRVGGGVYVWAGVVPTTLLIYLLHALSWEPVPGLGPVFWTFLKLSSILWNTLWLGTTLLALRASRQGRDAVHRRWAIRSVALGIAILGTRGTFSLAFSAPGGLVDLQVLQNVVGYVPWLFTLAAAELYLFGSARRAAAAA